MRRLIPVLILSAFLIPTGGDARASTTWSFVPIPSVMPPELAAATILAVGGQGALVVRDQTSGVRFFIVADGEATLLFAVDDPAPEGGTFTNLRQEHVVSPQRVVFQALVRPSPGTPTVRRNFLFDHGSLSRLPDEPAGTTYDMHRNDTQGRFLASRVQDEFSTEYWITDGVTAGPSIFLTAPLDLPPLADVTLRVTGITRDGAFLVQEGVGVEQGTTYTAETAVYFRGSREETLATGVWIFDLHQFIEQGDRVVPAGLNSVGDALVLTMTDLGWATWGRDRLTLHRPDQAALTVAEAGENLPLLNMRATSRVLTLHQQAIFGAQYWDADFFTHTGYFTGPQLADRFGGDFVSGFGQDGQVRSLLRRANGQAILFHEDGVAVVNARLADDTIVAALGRAGFQNEATWINPGGGEWSDPENWSPAQVPSSAMATRFDLDASYDVTVGEREAGGVRIESGGVSFRGADLEVSTSLEIGRAASLSVPEGRLRAMTATVGSVSPAPEGPQETAHLFVSNTATQVDVSASLRIGAAGAGEMFISDALVLAAEILIGGDGQGEVVITGPTEQPGGANGLGATSTLGLGGPGGGTLLLEEGGRATATSVVIGRGEIPGLQHSTIRMESYSYLFVFEGLTVGAQYPGLLDLAGGGRAVVGLDLIMGTVAHPDSSSLVNGEVRVAGILETEPTKLTVERDALLGMAAGTTVQVDVLDGGQIEVTREFSLADAAGSTAEVKVVGVGDGGFRSSLFVGEETSDRFMVGTSGRGRLTIQDGGEVRSLAALYVGQESGSQGRVIIQGRSGEFPSELRAPGACIGGYSLCETSPDAAGHLILLDGGTLILEGALGVGPNGRLSGSGEIRAVFASIAGRVDPGVQIITPARSAVASLNGDPDLPDLDGPGVLVIVGDVQLEPTAVLAMDIHGVDPALQDRLEITGTAVLGGTLELRFGNDYGPQQGDALTFLSADGGLDGSFDEVVIVGLEEGFEFELDFSDGEVVLIALNDATVGIASEPEQPLPDPVPVITALRLYPNQPNPFNPQTVLVYELPQSGAVRLEVFDLRGRLVRTLVDGALAAGRYEVLWDGRNVQGREQPSGVYLSRLRADGREVVGRMTLVR